MPWLNPMSRKMGEPLEPTEMCIRDSLYFGRIPAKLDDAANYLPSRLAALLWVAAAAFTHNDAKGAWKIWRRDRRNHACLVYTSRCV